MQLCVSRARRHEAKRPAAGDINLCIAERVRPPQIPAAVLRRLFLVSDGDHVGARCLVSSAAVRAFFRHSRNPRIFCAFAFFSFPPRAPVGLLVSRHRYRPLVALDRLGEPPRPFTPLARDARHQASRTKPARRAIDTAVPHAALLSPLRVVHGALAVPEALP